MRYYDPEKKTEVFYETDYPSDDPRVSSFFEPLPDGYCVDFDEKGFPRIVPLPARTAEETLAITKRQKVSEIEAAKTARFNEDATVKIGNKNYTIVGGLEAYDKYTKAYEIAKRMGITRGKIVVREGVVEVTEAEMKDILSALDTKNYRAEIKAAYLREAVARAQTVEEVEAIAW